MTSSSIIILIPEIQCPALKLKLLWIFFTNPQIARVVYLILEIGSYQFVIL